MRFPVLTFENTVQVDDKTRLDATKSFVTLDESVTDIEIEPEAGAGYVSIYQVNEERWFLDWAYDLDGNKVVSLRLTTDMGTTTKTYNISVLSVADDALFSSDNDLFPFEPKLDKYLPLGKSSFLYAHRASQAKILAYLDEQQIWKADGTRFTKQDIVDKEEFQRWSLFQTLLIIFEGSQLAVGDIFDEKRKEYENEMRQARNRSALRLDFNGNGNTEAITIRAARFVRR